MGSFRRAILAEGEIYHVFNRGVEKRTIFTNTTDFKRAIGTVNYYRFTGLPVRYSHFIEFNWELQRKISSSLTSQEVLIIAYCLMPNHFHFLLRQERENGIKSFLSNFSNSYSRYFNIKHERVGPLFQGRFKAVRVESNEQLLHLSRYIHLNPVASFLIEETDLDRYPWHSLHEYLNPGQGYLTDSSLVMNQFKNIEDYRKFVHDRISYAQELEKIKHLMIEEEV